jgi:hypothetical protein
MPVFVNQLTPANAALPGYGAAQILAVATIRNLPRFEE